MGFYFDKNPKYLYYNKMQTTKITKLPESLLEIEGQIEASVFENYFGPALKKIGENVEIDGFRKGKVPENILLQKISEMQILEEMAQIALGEHYPQILEQEKIDAIGRPEISILKLARNNPLEFKIKTAVLPEVKLPDYKKIAKKAIADLSDKDKDSAVSDEELENTINDIRKSRAPKINVAELEKEGGEIPKEKLEAPLPELNDEFVQALGPFKDVEDFKTKLKENLKLEKENTNKEKTRIKIVEKILEESTIELPEILIDSELTKILYRMESDITAMGLKFEDYLKHINKTKEDLQKEFRGDAEKKAKLALILNEIAKTENIKADEEQVAKEVAQILEHYKDADPERARMHAENVLTNEQIFVFLENL
jgi:trigger factor